MVVEPNLFARQARTHILIFIIQAAQFGRPVCVVLVVTDLRLNSLVFVAIIDLVALRTSSNVLAAS